MDRQAEIQRIKNKVTVAKWDMVPSDLVGDILDAAEYFTILAKWRKTNMEAVVQAAREYVRPSNFAEFEQRRGKLLQALADLDALGGGE